MSSSSDRQPVTQMEAFLSGAYRRIQRITIVLGLLGFAVAISFYGWRNGLGAAAGAIVGYVNFIWLHHASRMMTDRMMPSAVDPPSKLKVIFGFGGRYAFVVAAAYVILKSWPQLLGSFLVAVFFPIVAAMCEGVYEAFAKGNTGSPTD